LATFTGERRVRPDRSEELLSLGAALGFPSMRYRPGESIASGEASSRTFAANPPTNGLPDALVAALRLAASAA